MENFTVSATTRTVQGKQVSALRRNGQVPAVLYGHGKTNQSLTLEGKSFEKMYATAGAATLVNLEIDGAAGQKVLIHDAQYNAIRRELLHVDFYVVNLKEKLRVSVPVVLDGVAPAVDTLGGSLITVKDEVEIECLPEALVSELHVDLTQLVGFDDTIKVGALHAPKGVVILDDADEIIVAVASPKTEDQLDLDSDVSDTAATVSSETKSGTDNPPVEPEKK